jgi:hypothetical protein
VTHPNRLQILIRLRSLESFLCTGRRTKNECIQRLQYTGARMFLRDLRDLQALGSEIVRQGAPGKLTSYYCPRARAIFRHE